MATRWQPDDNHMITRRQPLAHADQLASGHHLIDPLVPARGCELGYQLVTISISCAILNHLVIIYQSVIIYMMYCQMTTR